MAARIIEIKSLQDPGIEVFGSLTEAQLRQRQESENGLFIAESPKVIRVAMQAGYQPMALLCERKHIDGDAADIIAACGDIPIYTGTRELLTQLTGYTMTRGVLCAMKRKPEPKLQDILSDAHRVCVIDAVCDTTNIGAIFRSAAALGIDAVLLTRSSCDPLNRRAIRVSMGTIFLVPWTWLDAYAQLKALGFKTAAMALTDQSISLDDPILKQQDKLAFIMGTEGDGLPQDTIKNADFTVRIPMYHQVDSLNVAAAAAVTFWELRLRPREAACPHTSSPS